MYTMRKGIKKMLKVERYGVEKCGGECGLWWGCVQADWVLVGSCEFWWGRCRGLVSGGFL